MSVVHHEHDRLSDAYVREWIESDAARDTERRPKLRRAASLLPFESADSIKVLDLGGGDGLGGPFDAVVSSIAIHNLRQPALIHDVYREVATVVAPGGAFLNLDYIFPRSPLLSELYGRASGSGGRGGAATSEGHVGQATLENQLRWLLEGFDEVDCVCKELHEVLLCALRAGRS